MYSKLLTALVMFFFVAYMVENSYMRAYLVERRTDPEPAQGRVVRYQVDQTFHYLSADEMAYARRIGRIGDVLLCCCAGAMALLMRYKMKTEPGSVKIFGKPSL